MNDLKQLAINILTLKVDKTTKLLDVDAKTSKRVLRLAWKMRGHLVGLENMIFFEIRDMKDIYYQNINYYKKFGGIYPSYEAIKDYQNVLDNLKTLRKKITKHLEHIQQDLNNKYTQSFEDYIYSLKTIFKETGIWVFNN